MEFLYNDSKFLQLLFEEIPFDEIKKESIISLLPNIKNLNKILDLYLNKYDTLTNEDYIILLEDLNYLDCSRFIDIIIIIKHKNIYLDFLNLPMINKLSNDVKNYYKNFKIENTFF